jgi:hypothetical protein
VFLEGTIYKRNAESLSEPNREVGLELKAEKSKYTVVSRRQNAGQNQNLLVPNKSFKNVTEVKNLGTKATNQNFIHE